MGIASIILVLVAVPTLFVLITWVVATAYRIYFPEKVLPIEEEMLTIGRRPAPVREPALVGVREIREEQRRMQEGHIRYYYTSGYSHGVPAAWIEELWQRRN